MTIYRKPYGGPRETRAIPNGNDRGRWKPLYHDALLRLEQTEQGRYLEYPFDSYEDAERAQTALTRYFRLHNIGDTLRAAVRREPGTRAPRLYVWREKPNERER
jgi:hypothetical protein